jgi:ribose transport system substrate-binding protein
MGKYGSFLVAGAVALTTMASMLSAQAADVSRPGKARSDLHFYFASPLVANPFWDQVEKGWKAACAYYGTQCEYVGPTTVDINTQLQYMEAALAQGVDGIVTDPLNPAQFATIFQQATDAGIPIVAMDSDAPDSARIAYYGSENKAAGKLLAETLVKLTDGKGKIGILTGKLDADNLRERIDGMKEVFAQHPDMAIVAEEADNYEINVGIQKVEAMIQAHPEMNAIAGLHSQTPQAITSALNELNLAGKIVATGWDAAPEGIDGVKNGSLNALLVQRPYDMGYWSAKSLIAIASGHQNDVAGPHDTGMNVFTKDNIDSLK